METQVRLQNEITAIELLIEEIKGNITDKIQVCQDTLMRTEDAAESMDMTETLAWRAMEKRGAVYLEVENITNQTNQVLQPTTIKAIGTTWVDRMPLEEKISKKSNPLSHRLHSPTFPNGGDAVRGRGLSSRPQRPLQ